MGNLATVVALTKKPSASISGGSSQKNATKIDVVDMRDGGIYLGTTTYYLYNNHLYVDEYHSNLNRYTGNDKVYIIIDDVKKDLDRYSDQYFIYDIGLTKEGYERLVECVSKAI